MSDRKPTLFVKVINPSDKAVGPISYGGREYIFQPDQKLNPGTSYMADEYPDMTGIVSEEDRRSRLKQFRRVMKHDKDVPARNFVDVPEEFAFMLKAPNPENARVGAGRLTFIDDKISDRESYLSSMDAAIAAKHRELAELNAKAEDMKARAMVQREADSLEAELAKHTGRQS